MIAELAKLIAPKIDPDLGLSLPPPFVGNWRALSAEEATVLLARLSVDLASGGVETPWPLAHEAIALQAVPMPCYGDAIYVDAVVRDRVGNVGRAGFLVFPEEVFPLQTISDPIHHLFDRGKLQPDSDEQIASYVRLFCWTICGDEGPFALVESASALSGAPINPPGDVEELISPLLVEAEDEETPPGIRFISATTQYGDTVFAVRFQLLVDGSVEMIDDNPLFILAEAPRWRITRWVKYLDGVSEEGRA